MVHLSLLGPVRVELDGQQVQNFKTQKAKALLIYLAVEARHPHSREALMALLWPDFSLNSAQQNLRQALYLLRQSLPGDPPPDLFLVDRLTASWNSNITLTLDINQFEELAGRSDPADRYQAAGLYRGNFLEDFFLPDSEPFEEWVGTRRAYYLNLAQDLMGGLVGRYMQEGDWPRAEEIARRNLELDRFQEAAHRQLIEIFARSGRRQDALRQYNALRRLLKEEFDLEPDPEIAVLVEAIRDGDLEPGPPTRPSQMPAPEPLPLQKTRHNLPHALTIFVGRRQELLEIESLVASHRLVMLTGAAGIGKTNLCLRLGHQLIDRFPDGIWMVELAPINDPAFLPKAVASAMGLSESSGRAVEDVLLDVLHDSRCLLILDNCEHLIEASARFAESVLRASPNVKILASSLEPFELAGEIQYPVQPLSNPEEMASATFAAWEQYDAIRLFVARAQAVSPDFQITSENIASVAEICKRLDGIPLAIELAAARVNLLSVGDIAARLDDRFNLLVSGRRTAVPRQQTLRGMMEWSWDLLSLPEKSLLQRLSVFAGEMSLPAVEGVCCGEDIEPGSVLDLLAQLVNKSFVVVKRPPGQERRYYLLETIRQYGQERLVAEGELERYRDRHLLYYLQLSEESEPNLVRAGQGVWIRRLTGELDNLRAALLWAQQTDPDAGIRLVTTMWRFWNYGVQVEGHQWLDRFRELAGEALDPATKAKCLWVQSRLNAWPVMRFDLIRKYAEAGLSLYRELGDDLGIARCLMMVGWSYYYEDPAKYESLVGQSLPVFRNIGDPVELGEVLYWYGFWFENVDLEKAKVYINESLALFREVGHLAGAVQALDNYAQLSIFHGDFDTARVLLEESLAIHKELGDRGASQAAEIMGHLSYRTGDYESAKQYLSTCLALSKQNGEKGLHYWATARMGHLALITGDLEQARVYFLSSLGEFRKVNIQVGVTFSVECLAIYYLRKNQPERAARLIGWADRSREAILDKRQPIEEEEVTREKRSIVALIGEDDYEAAYSEGQALSLEQAVELATRPVSPHHP